MKILLVEDNAEKAAKISSLLKTLPTICDDNIETAQDRISAKRELLRYQYDILLLDIQIPNRFDQLTEKDGGIKLLQEIKISDRYNIPPHIIGITAYDEVYSESFPFFSEELLGIVKYERESITWESQLLNRIESIIMSSQSNKNEEDYIYDLAIICALEHIELESIKFASSLWERKDIKNDPSYYYEGEFKNETKSIKFICSVAPQMGMPASAVLTSKLIHHFRPKYLAMTGITAGVKGAVKLGDILVADPSWDYGSGKYIISEGEKIFEPDPLPIRLDPKIKNIFQSLSSNTKILDEIKSKCLADKPSESLELHIGPVASGSAVIADPDFPRSISKHSRKLIGIEMETYGVMYAALNFLRPIPTCFSIKSVCDFADDEKNDKFQRYAAYTSSELLKLVSLEYLDL